MIKEILPRGSWARLAARAKSAWRGKIQGQVWHWPGITFKINSIQDEINLLNSILKSHLNNPKEKYVDIAYNWAVGRFNVVYELRGGQWQSGAHSPLNGTHEAVLLIYSTDEPLPQAIKDTAVEFRNQRMAAGVGSDLKAHKETSSTSCPGNDATAFTIAVRNGAATAPTPTPSQPAPRDRRIGGIDFPLPKGCYFGILNYNDKKNYSGKGDPARQVFIKMIQAEVSVPQTGIFDTATRNGVINYQKARGLGVDGLFGHESWNTK